MDNLMRWWHVVFGTHGSWLPGDARGFRDRRHRVHSSGDYKSPPPAGEHARLREAAARAMRPAVEVPPEARKDVVAALREASARRAFPLLAVASGDVHAHLLVMLSMSYGEAKRDAGQIKNGSSFGLRDVLPGRLWSHGTTPKAICDADHLREAFFYIRDRQERGAVTWGDAILFEAATAHYPRLPPRRREDRPDAAAEAAGDAWAQERRSHP